MMKIPTSRARCRRAWAVLWPLCLLLPLSGCVEQASSSPAEVKGGGGELRVTLQGEPRSLVPNSTLDETVYVVGRNIYNQLLSLDVDAKVLPDLADEWTVSADGREYTFKLHPGVRWHDGRPLTADDVVWTFERLAREGAVARDLAARVIAFETPDPATVVMRLAEPWAPFVTTLAWFGTYILPRPPGGGDGGDGAEIPVGTGPFKLAEWSRGEHITLVANPDYFRRGPYLDRIVYRFAADADAAVDALLAGQAEHTLARPGFERLAELGTSPHLVVRTLPGDGRYYCGFNLRRRPFDDVRVRAAINMALDRTALVDRALSGHGAPALAFYTPDVAWAYNAEARVPAFDLRRAEELLDEAGLPRRAAGVRFRAELVAPARSPFPELAGAMAEQLGRVGIEVRATLLPAREWLGRLVRRHDFDLGLMGGSQGPDPENLRARFGSRGVTQFMGYASAEFDDAVAAGARATRPLERAPAYFRAQEILARDLPVAPLAEAVRVSIYRRSVFGLPQAEARGLVPFADWSLVRLRPGGEG